MITFVAAIVMLTVGVFVWDYLTTPKMTLRDEENFGRLLVKAILAIGSIIAMGVLLRGA